MEYPESLANVYKDESLAREIGYSKFHKDIIYWSSRTGIKREERETAKSSSENNSALDTSGFYKFISDKPVSSSLLNQIDEKNRCSRSLLVYFLKLLDADQKVRLYSRLKEKGISQTAWSQYSGIDISISPERLNVIISICAESKYHSLKDLLDNFILYCYEHNIKHIAFLEHDNIVSSIIKNFENPLVTDVKEVPKERYLTFSSKENWLSPRNSTSIPFIGREGEISQLDDFALFSSKDGKQDFKIWAVVGPSGSGKTRLLTHWANRNVFDGWIAIDINSTNRNTIDWRDWSPEKPTIISIDYIYGYDDVLAGIINRMLLADLCFPVRLLILDHAVAATMEEILKNARWGLSGRRSEDLLSIEEHFFYNKNPLRLETPRDSSELFSEIISSVAFNSKYNDLFDRDKESVDLGIAYLKATTGAWQPLFAALVGEAIKRGRANNIESEAYMTLDRRSLIKNYLQGKTRLTWQMNERIKGLWIASFIATATLSRGAQFNKLRNAVPTSDIIYIDDNYQMFKSICNAVVAGENEIELGAFEPDLLGETHFLLLLEEIELNHPDRLKSLLLLLEASLELEGSLAASEFIGFQTRLIRNLANDDQDINITKTYWTLNAEFLKSCQSGYSPVLKWAASFTFLDIGYLLTNKIKLVVGGNYNSKMESKKNNEIKTGYEHVEDKGYYFLSQVDGRQLSNVPEWLISSKYIDNILRYLRYQIEDKGEISEGTLKLLTHWDSLEKQDLTSLLIAIKNRMPRLAEFLIENGAKVDFKAPDNCNALMWAIEYQLNDIALKLIDVVSDLDAQDSEGKTALYYASFRDNRDDIFLKLIEKGADLDICTNEGWTPLSILCWKKELKLANILVDNGADINIPNKYGWTAFTWACYLRMNDFALRLMEKGADLNAPLGMPPITHVCSSEDSEDLAIKMIDQGVNLNVFSAEGNSPLFLACHYKISNIAFKIIDKDPEIINVSCCNRNGCSPLEMAISSDWDQFAFELVKRGCDFKSGVNNPGMSALSYAAYKGLENTSKYLSKHSKYRNIRDSEGWTPLMVAISRRHENIAHMIIENEDDFSQQIDNGVTAMMLSISKEMYSISEKILDKYSDFTEQDTDGWTALMYACMKRDTDLALKLLECNSNINAKSKKNEGALALACRYCLWDVANILIDRGVDIDVVDRSGWNPVMLACWNDNEDLAIKLFNKGATFDPPKEDLRMFESFIDVKVSQGELDIERFLQPKT